MTPLILTALAVVFSGVVPTLMARLPALHRNPRAAVVLWQAVALAAVLAALGATLSLFTEQALRPHPGAWRIVVGVIALTTTALVLGRLLLTGHRVGTRTRARRREHRELVDLLAAAETRDLRIIEHETPLAYCLPSLRNNRVVLSGAALESLAPAELDAVLLHERAHLRARHDLVLEAFTVLHQAFPAVVSSSAALGQVRLLVEMLADDAARRRVGARPLARALVAVAAGPVPVSSLAAGGLGTLERIERLRDDEPHRLLGAVLYAAAFAVIALPTALVALPWLGSVLAA